jgi:hypothetical protein
VAIESGKPNKPALFLFHGAEYSSVRPVTVAAALLPLDETEFRGFHELVANNPITELIIYHCLMPGSIPVGTIGKSGRSVERIRKALQFWSRAELLGARLTHGYLTPWRVADAYLEYSTVLEILLGSGSELSEIIASRAAGILETVAEKRVEMRRTVKNLYGLRSKFVHEGSYLIRIAELHEIREIVRRCLIHSLRWLTAGSERLLREEPNRLESFFETVRVVLDSTESADERRAIEALSKIFADEDFGEHCDLLRFGNDAPNDR